MADEKKTYNGDTFGKYLRTTNISSLDGSVSAYDRFSEVAVEQYLAGSIQPAVESFTSKIGDGLEAKLGGNEAKVHNKKSDLEAALKDGLMGFFENYMPSVAKAAKELDEKDQLEYLASTFDGQTRTREEDPHIKDFIVNFAKDEKITVGKIKAALFETKVKYAQAIYGILQNKLRSHLFGTYQPNEIADYFKPEFEKQGLDVRDKARYMTSGLALLALREAMRTGGSDTPYERFGLVNTRIQKEKTKKEIAEPVKPMPQKKGNGIPVTQEANA